MTKGQVEAAVTRAMIAFEKEFMGRGPLEAKSHIIDDLILVRLQGVLTPAENQLARNRDDDTGRVLIKQIRKELIEGGRPLLEAALREIIDLDIVSMHTDISTRTGERVIVFRMAEIVPFGEPT
ncbi:MAG: hypothetical protein ACI8W8_001553 [Rhodothermales bacterium]|jgi:uncharacterized protein YbcI